MARVPHKDMCTSLQISNVRHKPGDASEYLRPLASTVPSRSMLTELSITGMMILKQAPWSLTSSPREVLL